MVDTGAARSMMREDVWRQLCKIRRQPTVTFPGLRLRALSGHELQTLGKATVRVAGKKCEFYIVKELQHDALMGDDILAILKAEISYHDRQVLLLGKSYVAMWNTCIPATMNGVYTDVDYWRGKFPTVFPQGDRLVGHTTSVHMSIDTGNAHPINQRPYRVPLMKRRFVEEEIDKMLEDGIIEPSTSPWASPITIDTKGKKWRLCTDYRKVNAITKKDAYPLPLIQDIFDSLQGSKIFSTLDLMSGYWQIPMHPSCIEKTAIATHRGLFQFRRMQFGLVNGPATFQRLMNTILGPYIGKFCMVYLDDIVVFSKTEEEHRDHLNVVLEALAEHQLVARAEKCHFAMKEVKLLGYIISEEGITSNPEKVEAIKNMAPPTDLRGVRSFLGMAGYYRNLIEGFADIAIPLTLLTKRYARFHWTEECHKAWETLRDVLASDTVLAYPQLDKPYKLYSDASKYAVGSILCQLNEEGVERPVMYISKQLSETQQRWPVVEREAYSVIYALRKLRPYLHGADFTIYTDHKPLKCLFQNEIKNSKVQCWAVTLAEYAAPIEYRPGKLHIRPDMLSRIRQQVPGELAPMDPTMAAAVLGEYFNQGLLGVDGIKVQELLALQRQMPEYQAGMDEEDHYHVSEGLLFTLKTPPGQLEYPRLVLPGTYRQRVIKRAHEEVGHMGVIKTLHRIQEAYKWPKMHKEVASFITRCPACVVNTDHRDKVRPDPMPIAEYPGQVIAMDICGPYVPSRTGNKYILTLIDHATGYAEAYPIPDKTQESVYYWLQRDFIPRNTPMEIIITDCGMEFRGAVVQQYLKELGVNVRKTCPYNPRSNGRIERFHRTLKDIIRKLVNARPTEWEDRIGDALLAHRTAVSSASGFSPFFLNYARHPTRTFFGLLNRQKGSQKTRMAQRVDDMASALQVALKNAYVNREYNLDRLNKQANAGPLEVGDTVIMIARDTAKMDPKWDYGFMVTRIRGKVITVVGPNGVRKQVARENIKKVNPDVKWADLRKPHTRAARKATVRVRTEMVARRAEELQQAHQEGGDKARAPQGDKPKHPLANNPLPDNNHGGNQKPNNPPGNQLDGRPKGNQSEAPTPMQVDPPSRRRAWEGVQGNKGSWTRSRHSDAKRIRLLAPDEESCSQAKQLCIDAVRVFVL